MAEELPVLVEHHRRDDKFTGVRMHADLEAAAVGRVARDDRERVGRAILVEVEEWGVGG